MENHPPLLDPYGPPPTPPTTWDCVLALAAAGIALVAIGLILSFSPRPDDGPAAPGPKPSPMAGSAIVPNLTQNTMENQTEPTPARRPRIKQERLKTSILWADKEAAERLSTHLLGMNKPGKKPMLVREKTEHGFKITFPMETADGTVKACTVFEFHHISNQPLGRRIDYDPRIVSIKEQ